MKNEETKKCMGEFVYENGFYPNALEFSLWKHGKSIIFGTLALGMVAAPLLGYWVLKEGKNRSQLESAYHQALLRYADSNNDGFISSAEQNEFYGRVSKNNGAVFIQGKGPRYENETQVPKNVFNGWIRNYDPRE